MVTIHHVDDLLAPTLGHEEARILAGLPQLVGGVENLTLRDDTQSAEGLEPQHSALSHPRQLRGETL